MSRPYPVAKDTVCSECGLDWYLHPPKPRRRDCIKLLKARSTITYPYVYTYPDTTWNLNDKYNYSISTSN